MNTQLASIKQSDSTLPVASVKRDDTDTKKAINNARMAARCASQLSNDYHNILHRQLNKVAPELADRFTALITELAIITDAVYECVAFHQSKD